jgi:hypothetical protein
MIKTTAAATRAQAEVSLKRLKTTQQHVHSQKQET